MIPSTEYAIAFSAGATACMYIYRQVDAMQRERKNGNGKVKTFAQDPEHYWESMRANVTDPISRILDNQTRIISSQVQSNHEVMLKLVQLEERTRR